MYIFTKFKQFIEKVTKDTENSLLELQKTFFSLKDFIVNLTSIIQKRRDALIELIETDKVFLD